MWVWWKRKMEIYSKLKDTYSELNIPMETFFGNSSDTTNAMFGQQNSGTKTLAVVASIRQSNTRIVPRLETLLYPSCRWRPISFHRSYSTLTHESFQTSSLYLEFLRFKLERLNAFNRLFMLISTIPRDSENLPDSARLKWKWKNLREKVQK